MRVPLVLFLLAVAGAFLLGREGIAGPAAATTRGRIYTGQFGDVFRVPKAATRCFVSAEAGSPNVICEHIPVSRARYEVVFYGDNLFVYRIGKPDNPLFSARGKP